MKSDTNIGVRPHPAGGFAVAVPFPGTLTAKVYVSQHPTERDAIAAARAAGAAEGQLALALIRKGLRSC